MPIQDGTIGQHWADRAANRIEGSPFAKRILAFISDYLIAGLIAALPMGVASLFAEGVTLGDLSSCVEAGFGLWQVSAMVAASLAFSYAYFVILPFKVWPGQTIGKRLAGIEVVMLDGSPATLGALSIRWAFMVFVETFFSIGSSFVIQLIELTSGTAASSAFALTGAAVSIVSGLRVLRAGERRALHDVIAGTWVYTNE